jgi:hypothetical protein
MVLLNIDFQNVEYPNGEKMTAITEDRITGR